MKNVRFKTTMTRTVCIWITVMFTMFLGQRAFAQDGSVAKAKMEKLSSWIGSWKGEGWQMDQSGKRNTFQVTEQVESKLEGMAILVEGKGENTEGYLGHHAIGLIFYDMDKNVYRFSSTTQEGNSSLSELKVEGPGKFVWGFEVPGGKVRFTITLTEDTWNEKGAFGDGNNWYPFLEMNLKKVKN